MKYRAVFLLILVWLNYCCSTQTILETIRTIPHLKTLTDHLIRFPVLLDLLSSPHVNLTFFAPNNAAFAKSPLPKRPASEHSVWLYMTLPSRLHKEEMHYGRTLDTLLILESLGGNPQRIRISDDGFGKLVNRHARVLEADINASNGIIHILDSILQIPPSTLFYAHRYETFSIAYQALKRSHLLNYLSKTGPMTFLAPLNTAFEKLEHRRPGFLGFLFSKKGAKMLRMICLSHLVKGLYYASDLAVGKTIVTNMAGNELALEKFENGQISVNALGVLTILDVFTSNGVIHALDEVILAE